MKSIYTTGYEGKTIEQFLYELQATGIKQVLDVRQIALSRKKGFSKRQLGTNLAAIGITYHHLSELGSPAEARQQVRKDKNYTKLFSATRKAYKTKDAREAYEQVKVLAKTKKSALLCFCLDAAHCHRKVLSDMLTSEGWTVHHLTETFKKDERS